MAVNKKVGGPKTSCVFNGFKYLLQHLPVAPANRLNPPTVFTSDLSKAMLMYFIVVFVEFECFVVLATFNPGPAEPSYALPLQTV